MAFTAKGIKDGTLATLTLLTGAVTTTNAQQQFKVNAGPSYSILMGNTSLYSKPLQAGLTLSGRNMFGTNFLGANVDARLPLSGPFNINDPNRERAANGGEVTSITNAELFIGRSAENERGTSFEAGITLGAAFASVKNKDKPLTIMPSGGFTVTCGLNDRFELGFNTRFYSFKSLFNSYTASNGVSLTPSTGNSAVEVGFTFRYNLVKKSTDRGGCNYPGP